MIGEQDLGRQLDELGKEWKHPRPFDLNIPMATRFEMLKDWETGVDRLQAVCPHDKGYDKEKECNLCGIACKHNEYDREDDYYYCVDCGEPAPENDGPEWMDREED